VVVLCAMVVLRGSGLIASPIDWAISAIASLIGVACWVVSVVLIVRRLREIGSAPARQRVVLIALMTVLVIWVPVVVFVCGLAEAVACLG